MANDESRGASLRLWADRIVNEELTEAERNQLAHEIKKYVALVIDRDAGPSDLLKVENTKLGGQVVVLEKLVEEARGQLETAGLIRSEAVRLQRANTDLAKVNRELIGKNAELITKHNEIVDQFAKADQARIVAEQALTQSREQPITD